MKKITYFTLGMLLLCVTSDKASQPQNNSEKSPEKGVLTIVSTDDTEHKLSESFIEQSQTLKNMVEDAKSDTAPINVPLSEQDITDLITLTQQGALDRDPTIEQWVSLIRGADFLENENSLYKALKFLVEKLTWDENDLEKAFNAEKGLPGHLRMKVAQAFALKSNLDGKPLLDEGFTVTRKYRAKLTPDWTAEDLLSNLDKFGPVWTLQNILTLSKMKTIDPAVKMALILAFIRIDEALLSSFVTYENINVKKAKEQSKRTGRSVNPLVIGMRSIPLSLEQKSFLENLKESLTQDEYTNLINTLKEEYPNT